jgi:hypothetical protein
MFPRLCQYGVDCTYRKHGFLKTRFKVKSMFEYGRFLLPGMVGCVASGQMRVWVTAVSG